VNFAFFEVKFMDATEEVLGLVPFSRRRRRRGLSSGQQQQQQQQQDDATLMMTSSSTRTHDISDGMNFPSKADLGRNMIEFMEQEQQDGDGTSIDDELTTNDGIVDDAHHRHLAASKITKNHVVNGQKSTVTLSCVLKNEKCKNLGQTPNVEFGNAQCVSGTITVTILPGNQGWSTGAEEQIAYALRAGFFTTKIGKPFIYQIGDPFLSTNFLELKYPQVTSVSTSMTAIVPTKDDTQKIVENFEEATDTVIAPGQQPGSTTTVTCTVKYPAKCAGVVLISTTQCIQVDLLVTTSPGNRAYTSKVPVQIKKAVRDNDYNRLIDGYSVFFLVGDAPTTPFNPFPLPPSPTPPPPTEVTPIPTSPTPNPPKTNVNIIAYAIPPAEGFSNEKVKSEITTTAQRILEDRGVLELLPATPDISFEKTTVVNGLASTDPAYRIVKVNIVIEVNPPNAQFYEQAELVLEDTLTPDTDNPKDFDPNDFSRDLLYRVQLGEYKKGDPVPGAEAPVMEQVDTGSPTGDPTDPPTKEETGTPTDTPPTESPTDAVSTTPTETIDTAAPTAADTAAPTAADTAAPTAADTDAPTAADTDAPTAADTDAPTAADTDAPTAADTDAPTAADTDAPTAADTESPTPLETEPPINEIRTIEADLP